MSWRNESERHRLSALGVKTKSDHHPVYVGGRTHLRKSDFKPKPEGGKRYPTDLTNCFHTSLQGEEAYAFALDSDDNVYRVELDLSGVPEHKILRQEDWTPFMVYIFANDGVIPLDFLLEKRPDMREYLIDELGYEVGITIDDIDGGIFDVFAYHPRELTHEVKAKYPDTTYRIPNEEEVAIFNLDIIKEGWDNRELVPKEELIEMDRKWYKESKDIKQKYGGIYK